MQHQRDPKPGVGGRKDPADLPGAPLTPEERPTAKYSVSSTVPRSARWEGEETLEDVAPPRRKLDSLDWDDDDEPVTSQRSVPRMALNSTRWESVHPEELVPSVPPPAPPTILSAAPPAAQGGLSVGPVAFEVEDDGAPIDFRKGIFPLWGRFAIGAVAAAALVVGIQTIENRGARSHGPSPASAVQPLPAPAPPRAEESIPPPPVPAPSETGDLSIAAAAPTTGTIVGSPDHRLFIDGRRATSWTVEVTCGKHTVRNGTRGAERTVNVPCGGKAEVPR